MIFQNSIVDSNPLVSIIIPCYNRELFIGDAISSILSQTYTNIELIIVDDSSKDGSIEVIRKYGKKDPRIKLFENEGNKGAPYCRNFGFERSSGKFINFFDSDDIMHPEKISQQVSLFNQDENLDVAICQTRFFINDFSAKEELWNKRLISDNLLADFVAKKIGWSTNAPLWSRMFLKKVGGFKLDLRASQDWEFHVRAILYRPNIEVSSDELVFNRKHNTGSIGRSKYKFYLIEHLNARESVWRLLKGRKLLNKELEDYFYSYFVAKSSAHLQHKNFRESRKAALLAFRNISQLSHKVKFCIMVSIAWILAFLHLRGSYSIFEKIKTSLVVI